ncbi:pantetheine-phosphate adenylyltransferase [Lactobacillus sp. ESL0791]|uniref:pantetheine-phosphate adenylyltransferase n=1 Tax=Lactobacillus sp. ESL0791 TaxID=2983234 RepID=UPI0023F7EE50|nr:pantetheine-phosphate adenylyltransferase [Lactobacillus sp. ESL0791]MDF7638838.1 pantetheine-phosphate adenylyltransferase [Lactobacillus sp. ESL0791]
MTSALFPGSFDPITNGHVDVALQAAAVFDKVFVVIMTNTAKNYLFTADERAVFARDALKNNPKIEVLLRPDSLTVDVAKKLGASVIIRGVRNSADFLYEQQIANTNTQIAPNLHTALFFTKPENSFVASSIIKEIAQFGGSISTFMPEMAAAALKLKFGQNNEKKKK